MEDAERLFIEDFDTWDMTGYYLYSKYWRAGVSAHIGTGGNDGHGTIGLRGSLNLIDDSRMPRNYGMDRLYLRRLGRRCWVLR
jgi:hypothetical protein